MRTVFVFATTLTLAACAAPNPTALTVDMSRNEARSLVQASQVNARGLTQAAERAFGMGMARDDVPVIVGGQSMSMRIVAAEEETFAVVSNRGLPAQIAETQDWSTEVALAAEFHSGCSTGQVWRRVYAKDPSPRYAVHLQC